MTPFEFPPSGILRPLSFRDPDGILIPFKGRIYRFVSASGLPSLEAFEQSATVQQMQGAGEAIASRRLPSAERDALLGALAEAGVRFPEGGEAVEHERVALVSVPSEWSAEAIYEAGRLTIDMALRLLGEGLGLKDATPRNVLFRGTRPVFVDALSVERRTPGDARWNPYAQFVRNFLLPLALRRDSGVPTGPWFLSHGDGIEPAEIYPMLGWRKRLSSPYLSLVTMPKLLGERRKAESRELYEQKLDRDPERARFILERVLQGLLDSLEAVRPPQSTKSDWSDYMSGNNNYSSAQFRQKAAFVDSSLQAGGRGRVLDVGCNDGYFSAMAARQGAQVVAIDYDHVVVDRVWRTAKAENLDILPLVVNLARPTPATGWMNQELPSFLERAENGFDTVLMLAVIHHMLVTERIPLDWILDQAARFTRRRLIIEFVGTQDSMFQRLTRGRAHLYEGLTPERFELSAARWFEVVRKEPIEGSERIMYLLEKRC